MLTWPHLDFPQHVRSSQITFGGRAAGWPNGTGWRHIQEYVPGTNVLCTRSKKRGGLRIEQRAVAIADALAIAIRTEGLADAHLRWELGFQVGGQPLANALVYHPDRDLLHAYFREYSLAIGAVPSPSEVRAGAKGAGGRGVSHPGGRRLAAVGEVGATLDVALEPGRTVLLLIAFGSGEDALERLVEVRRQLDRRDDWPLEFAPPPLSGATRAAIVNAIPALSRVRPAASDAYARSVLTIAQLTDRSGALLAAPAVDARYRGSGGYGYSWPRDGAFIAHALDVAGERGASRAFYEWILKLQPESGIWDQRYFADGQPAPSWAAHQLDETGAVLWGLDHHIRVTDSPALVAPGLAAAVRAFQGVSRLASETGWPPVTQNLWEDQDATHLYTLAALLAAATAWATRARDIDDREAAALLVRCEVELRAALDAWPTDRKTGALARAVVPGRGRKPVPDFTPDASLLGLSVPFGVLPVDDPRLQATVHAIEKDLVKSSGRVRRYRGDGYRGGNPWPLFSLWLAWHYLRAGQERDALKLYDRVLVDRTPAGLFAEQVDARSGEARWVVPLAWAHAWFLEVTHAMLPPAPAASRDFFFDPYPSVQELRRARALYGGLFHDGMPLSNGTARSQPELKAQSRTDLALTMVTAEITGGPSVSLVKSGAPTLPSPASGGGTILWKAALPVTDEGPVVRYRIRGDRASGPPIYAADADPRAGGQNFAIDLAAQEVPAWTADAYAYQVMVDRFATSGGKSWPPLGSPTQLYGGSLDGIRERLDYIAGLGVNLLWLSPVMTSPSHHGYDQADHLAVEPRYGGNAALTRLVQAAHDRGIRVLLDFVPNHTGRTHPLFLKAIQQDSDAAGFYRFWQWPHYYRAFFDHIVLPELDTARESVQEYLVGVAQRWVTEFGVDGLRLDHVPGVDPSFWVRLRRGLREVRPDIFLLGEVFGDDAALAAYRGRLDGVVDFGLARLLRRTFAEAAMGLSEFDRELRRHERSLAGLVQATILDNHDMNRFLWLAGGDKAKLRLAATALLTLPGLPILYYGTEVGLSQRRDGVYENAEARLPMLWGDDQDSALLAHFQTLGRIRRESLALRHGSRDTLIADREVYAYRRMAGDDSVVVVLNRSEGPQRRRLKAGPGTWIDRMNLATVRRDGSDLEVVVPPQAGAILGVTTAGR
jgi:glycosidase